MYVNVNSARDDIPILRIQDLDARLVGGGKPWPDCRDRLPFDRNIRPLFTLGANQDTIRDDDIVIHGDRFRSIRET